jgi:hypothetical protein
MVVYLKPENRSQSFSKPLDALFHRIRACSREGHAEEHVICICEFCILLCAEPASLSREDAAFDAGAEYFLFDCLMV